MIQLSEKAVTQIQHLKKESGTPDYGLRVSVVGGGCSGLSYKLDFQKESTPQDKVIEIGDIKVFIDPKSFLYVKGLTLDYEGGLNGTGFTFINPNAKKSCGCGTSFAV